MKQLVIAFSMSFEIEAEIEHRLFEGTRFTKKECDEQAAETAVAVQEWVNGFKLNVRQSGFNEKRNALMLRMKEALQLIKSLHDEMWGRGHKRCVAGSRSTDPVLGLPKLAWLFGASASVAEQYAVNLSDQPQRQRKIICAQAA
ncbi:hypothetical protein ACVI1L_004986 [Bradyrhizobium sp. USDA 4516]